MCTPKLMNFLSAPICIIRNKNVGYTDTLKKLKKLIIWKHDVRIRILQRKSTKKSGLSVRKTMLKEKQYADFNKMPLPTTAAISVWLIGAILLCKLHFYWI